MNIRTERSIDHEIKQFKEFIKSNRITWTEEEKRELEDPDPSSGDEKELKNTDVHFGDMDHFFPRLLCKLSHGSQVL